MAKRKYVIEVQLKELDPRTHKDFMNVRVSPVTNIELEGVINGLYKDMPNDWTCMLVHQVTAKEDNVIRTVKNLQ